jgi:hypothetical protein
MEHDPKCEGFPGFGAPHPRCKCKESAVNNGDPVRCRTYEIKTTKDDPPGKFVVAAMWDVTDPDNRFKVGLSIGESHRDAASNAAIHAANREFTKERTLERGPLGVPRPIVVEEKQGGMGPVRS